MQERPDNYTMRKKERSCSRRDFLKLATAGVVGVGVVGWLRAGCADGAIICSRCSAEFDEGHSHQTGPVQGVYCPNCGVELSRLEYDLRKQSRFDVGKRKAGRVECVWDSAQVPFPNSSRVRRTDKPTLVLSELKI